MLETALTEAEVLCEGVLIRPTLAGLLAVHEEGTHLPSADIQIQYAAGSAAIALGEYYMSMKEPEEAWVYLEDAVDIGKRLKYYQLRSDAMKGTCRTRMHYANQLHIIQTKLACYQTLIQTRVSSPACSCVTGCCSQQHGIRIFICQHWPMA